MKQQPSIAILVRSPERWSEALDAGKTLQASGAAVTIFFLGTDFEGSRSHFQKFREFLGNSPIQCFANHTAGGNVACLSLESIAQRMRQCDLVVPI